MLNRVRAILTPPVFPDNEDKTRKAKYANAIALAFLAIIVVYETIVRISLHYSGVSVIDVAGIVLAMVCIVGVILLRRGHVRTISILLVAFIWLATNGIAATNYGVRDSSYIINFAVILMAGLLLSWQASLIVTAISIISGLLLAYAEQNGLIFVEPYPATLFVQDMAFIFSLNAVLIYLLISGLESALKTSKNNLEQLSSAHAVLSSTQIELRHRSTELSVANEQLENRTTKLRAIAEVTQIAAAIRNFELLLPSITSMISNKLGYYHVGIFLLDEQKEFALLRSANTEGGAKMLSQHYRLPIGPIHLISSVAQSGQARIALQTEKGFFSHPDLSETQSAIALPLKSGDQLLGVLDIQSIAANAFSEDDRSALSILANQVAIAIENALLYEESQQALQEAHIASLQASGRTWKAYAETLETSGYRYDGIRSEPLKNAQPAQKDDNALLIPVQLRGQTIGRLRLKASNASRQWTEDELTIVKATAERVALALESARLLEEAQERATRETFLSDVAAKLSTSFQLDSILRDTVEELGQTLKHSTVTFQLVNPTESNVVAEPKSNGRSPMGTKD